MADKNFYDSVQEVLALPDEVDKKHALNSLFKSWREKKQVVADVLSDCCTFESVVKPVVEENLRIKFPYYLNGTCKSKKFEQQAKEIDEKLSEIICLWKFVHLGRIPSYVDLFSPINFPTFQFGTFFSIGFFVVMIAALLFSHGEVVDSIANFDFGTFLSSLKKGFLAGLGFASFQFLISAPGYMRARREFAKKVLIQAQYLDSVVRKYAN